MIKTLLLLGLVLYFPVIAWASELFIQWQAPTTREDGSPLNGEDIVRYNVRAKAPLNEDYQSLAPVVSETGVDQYNLTYPLDQVAGEYCFQLQTLDNNDFVSQWSDPACVTYVPVFGPSTPSNILIEIRIKPRS